MTNDLKRATQLLSEALTIIECAISNPALRTLSDKLKYVTKAKRLAKEITSKLGSTKFSLDAKPLDPYVESKEYLNTLLITLLGSTDLVQKWWKSPNRAFNNNPPEIEYEVNKVAVISYIKGHVFR